MGRSRPSPRSRRGARRLLDRAARGCQRPIACGRAGVQPARLGSARCAPASIQSAPAPTGPVDLLPGPGREAVLLAASRSDTQDGGTIRAVHASEDVSFDDKPPELPPAPERSSQSSGKRVLYYRNPMGLPDTSPVPKKDSMGMDYIPVYEGEDEDGTSSRSRPARSSAQGCGRSWWSAGSSAPGAGRQARVEE